MSIKHAVILNLKVTFKTHFYKIPRWVICFKAVQSKLNVIDKRFSFSRGKSQVGENVRIKTNKPANLSFELCLIYGGIENLKRKGKGVECL